MGYNRGGGQRGRLNPGLQKLFFWGVFSPYPKEAKHGDQDAHAAVQTPMLCITNRSTKAARRSSLLAGF